jgi:hypothetical protein
MEGRGRSAGVGVVLLGLTLACTTQPSVTHQERLATPATPGSPPARQPGAAAANATSLGAQSADPASPRTFRTATGTLAAFDRRERLLTVEAATGSSSYRVATDARAWLGRRRVPVSDLASYVGAQVTIAFGEVNGVRTTHTVRLAEGERAPRPR